MYYFKIFLAPFIFFLTPLQRGLSLINIWPWLHEAQITAYNRQELSSIIQAQVNTSDKYAPENTLNTETLGLPQQENVNENSSPVGPTATNAHVQTNTPDEYNLVDTSNTKPCDLPKPENISDMKVVTTIAVNVDEKNAEPRDLREQSPVTTITPLENSVHNTIKGPNKKSMHFYLKYYEKYKDTIMLIINEHLQAKDIPVAPLYNLCVYNIFTNPINLHNYIENINTCSLIISQDIISIMQKVVAKMLVGKVYLTETQLQSLDSEKLNLLFEAYEYGKKSFPLSKSDIYGGKRNKVYNTKKVQKNKATQIQNAINDNLDLTKDLMLLATKWGLKIENTDVTSCFTLPLDEDARITQLRIALLQNIFCDPKKIGPDGMYDSCPARYAPKRIGIKSFVPQLALTLQFGNYNEKNYQKFLDYVYVSIYHCEFAFFVSPFHSRYDSHVADILYNRLAIKNIYQELIKQGYRSMRPLDHLTTEQQIALSICVKKEDNASSFLEMLQKKIDIINTLKTTVPTDDTYCLTQSIVTYLQQDANHHWIRVEQHKPCLNEPYQANETNVIIDHPFHFEQKLQNNQMVYMNECHRPLQKIDNARQDLFNNEQTDGWGIVKQPIDTNSYKIYKGTLYERKGTFKVSKVDKNYHRPYLQIEFLGNDQGAS